MRQARAALSAVCVGVMLALAGCGGGGGGGGGGVAGEQPVDEQPAIDTSQRPLSLTADNAFSAASNAFTLGTLTLAIAQAAADLTEIATAGQHVNLSCPADGLTRKLTDRDGDGAVSPGDTLRVDLADCALRPMGGMSVSGSLTIDYVASGDPGIVRAGTITLGSTFGWTTSGINVRPGGALVFEQRADRLRRSVRVRSAATPFTWSASDTQQSVRDTITALDATHEARRDTARSTTTLALHLASQRLGGAIDVTTPTMWRSWFGNYPDAGAMLISGAGSGSLQVTSAGDGTEIVALTLNGSPIARGGLNGSQTGMLWSSSGWVSDNPGGLGYLTTRAVEPSLALVMQTLPSTLNPRGSVFEWAFSRPLATTQTLGVRFVRSPGYSADDIVQANVVVEGALLTISPAAQLEPGATYWLHFDNFTGVVTAANGLTLSLPEYSAPVANTIQANAQAVGGDLLLGSGSELVLDASASSAPGSRVAATRWRQLSGPALTLFTPDSPTTRVTPATAKSGNALIEVQVTNAAGEVDTMQLTLRVVGSLVDVLVWQEQVDGRAARIITSAEANDDSPPTVHYQSGFVDVILRTPSVWYRLLTDIGRVGDFSYPGEGNVSWTGSPDSNCTNGASGQLHMRELGLGSSGALERLAFDLEQTCPGRPTVRSSVRFNSSLPLRD